MVFAGVIGVRLDDAISIGVQLDDGIVSSIAQWALTNAVGNYVNCKSGDPAKYFPMNPPKVRWWFLGLVGW